MSYLNVITLDQAKTYLRVDGTDSDNEITRMIKSALSLLEKRTNIMVYERDITYILDNGCLRVYDSPINSVGSATATFELSVLSTFFTDIGQDTLELNVGYMDPTGIPSEIIDAAYEMIDYWYYKNDGKANITLIPQSVQDVIDSNRRFIV